MAPFEFAVTMPPDPTLAAMVRDLVAHGGRQAGADDETALSFGCTAEDAVRHVLDAVAPHESLSILVRMQDGPMQVVIAGGGATRTLALDI